MKEVDTVIIFGADYRIDGPEICLNKECYSVISGSGQTQVSTCEEDKYGGNLSL